MNAAGSHSLRCRAITCASSILFVELGVAPAQEALRTALDADQAYRARNAPQAREAAQLRAGPVLFDASLSYSLQWRDNVQYVSSDSHDDYVHRIQANGHAFWPATKDSTLSLGLGVGYEAYMNNSDLNRAFVAPDSELAWDIPVKDFVFTLYDRFSYSEDVASQGALSGVSEFPRFENTAGLRARWYPNKYLFELGYAHYNFFATSSEFDYLERSSEQFFGRAGYRLTSATQIGLEASGSLNNYNDSTQQDNTSASVGPFIEWQITPAIQLGLRGGYVTYSYDKSALNRTTSDTSSYYFGFSANHQWTDHITHGVTASRDYQQGINQGSQAIELYTVQYHLTWAFHHRASISGNFLYEHGTEPLLGINQKYDRYGTGATLGYQIFRHLSSSLGYQFLTKDANSSSQDYDENTVTFNLTYHF
jgi:putative beta-barrel porin BBP2